MHMRALVLVWTLAAAWGAHAASENSTSAADRGHDFALARCSACHAVEAGRASPNRRAPTFVDIAPRYGERSLQRKLTEIEETGHYDMPPNAVHSDEVADLAAYLERLNASQP